MTTKTGFCAALAATLLALTFQGCAPRLKTFSDALYLDSRVHPCRYDGTSIEILQELPDRPFERLAMVEASAAYQTDEASWGALREELCRQAIEAGGDAVVELTTGDHPYSWNLELGLVEVSRGGTLRRLTGVAIVYSSAPAPAPAPGPADPAAQSAPAEPSSGSTTKSR